MYEKETPLHNRVLVAQSCCYVYSQGENANSSLPHNRYVGEERWMLFLIVNISQSPLRALFSLESYERMFFT